MLKQNYFSVARVIPCIHTNYVYSLPARFSRRVKFARVRPQFWASKVTIKRPFTYKLNFTVGIAHVTASRDFVEYALTNEIAQDLSAWLNDTYIPDESFFSTLQHNQLLKAPGGSIGKLYFLFTDKSGIMIIIVIRPIHF